MSENLKILIKEKTDHGVIRFTMNDLVSKNALSKKLKIFEHTKVDKIYKENGSYILSISCLGLLPIFEKVEVIGRSILRALQKVAVVLARDRKAIDEKST